MASNTESVSFDDVIMTNFCLWCLTGGQGLANNGRNVYVALQVHIEQWIGAFHIAGPKCGETIP